MTGPGMTGPGMTGPGVEPNSPRPMSQARPKVVLQAHATRSLTALALLLHARDRGPRDMRKPLGALIASLVVAIVIVVAVAVGGRVGAMIGH